MHDPHCLRLRLVAACRQSYDSIIAGHDPYGIGWTDLGPLVENPKKIPKEPDVALVGRIPEGVLIVFRGTRPPGKDDSDPVSTVRDWLKKSNTDAPDDQAQRKLRAAAARCLGALTGLNSRRAETAREAVRRRLKRRYAR